MSRIRKQYKFMCWWNFGGISPRTIQHIIFCCWKVSILSKASSLPIHVQVLRRSPREEHISHFVHEWRNRNWALQKHNAEGKPVPITLLLLLVELYHSLTLHPVHQVHLCSEGNYYLWVSFTIWGFIGSMSVGSWVVARLARSRAIYFEHVSIVEGEGGYGIISPTSTVGWLRWGGCCCGGSCSDIA